MTIVKINLYLFSHSLYLKRKLHLTAEQSKLGFFMLKTVNYDDPHA